MSYRGKVETLGIVGTGVIGAGWAARALACGLDVVAWDPGAGAEAKLRAAIDNAWPALIKLGLFPGASRERLRFVASVQAVAEQADFIQESAPDRLDLKHDLHTEIDRHAAPDVLIASSSSGLLPTEIQADCQHAQRVLIGHPFNPVYLLPLVELVGGERTDAQALTVAGEVYKAMGMHPLLVRNEIEGYLSDRLQEALWRENLHLVNDGVATTEELDDAIVYGPGLRWAFMGVNKTFHLAGGDAGMRHMLEQFGPALELPWTKLEAPELTDDLIEAMVSGTQAQTAGTTIKQLEQLRDDCLVSIMQALRGYNEGAGRILNENFERLEAAIADEGWQPGDESPEPLTILEREVASEWIDYNGHMSAPYYHVAFDDAIEAFFQYCHHDADYREQGLGFFTSESHVNFYRECKVGEMLSFSAQVVHLDEKRMHLYLRMTGVGELRATCEQMFIHVDTNQRKAAPMPAGALPAFAALWEAHKGLPRPDDLGRQVGARRSR